MKITLALCALLLAGCGGPTPYEMTRKILAPRLAAECPAYASEHGVYSWVRGEDVYFQVYMTTTDWISESDSLVLLINTHGSVEVNGVEQRYAFARSQLKLNPSFAKAEIELTEIGAASGWVRAETSGGCFVGSYFFPFGKGNG